MEIRRILKVYNYVNDEKTPKVTLKFALGVVALLATGGALVGFLVAQDSGQRPTAPQAESRTEYVGLSTDEIQAGSFSPSLAEQRWSEWRSAHPDAEIEQREAVRVGDSVVGYRVTYREA